MGQKYWDYGSPSELIGSAPGGSKYWDYGLVIADLSAGADSGISVRPSGIATATAFGTPSMAQDMDVGVPGIGSSTQLGSPSLAQAAQVLPSGIDSTILLGNPEVYTGQYVYPSGIDNGAVLGTPEIQLSSANVLPSGINETIIVGTPLVKGPPIKLFPVGISNLVLGIPGISTGLPAAIKLFIRESGGGFVDRTEYLNVNSMYYDKRMDDKCSIRFTLDVEDGSYRPPVGVEIYVEDGMRRAFGGFVTDVIEYFHPATQCYHYEVNGVDYSVIMERRLVMRNYTFPFTPLNNVVKDIAENILAPEGIIPYEVYSVGTIPNEEFKFDLVSVADAYRRCSELYPAHFWIDQFKQLHYLPEDINNYSEAPMQLTETSEDAADIHITRTTNGLRTVQYVRSDVNLTTNAREESFVAVGRWPEDSMFVTKFPIVGKPKVTVNDAVIPVWELYEAAGPANGFRYLESGYGVFTYPQGFYKESPTKQDLVGTPSSNLYPLWSPPTSITSVYRNGVPDTDNWLMYAAGIQWIGGDFLAESDRIAVVYEHTTNMIPSYLNAGDVIKVVYDAQASNIVAVRDEAAIAQMAAIDGGSGIWEECAEQRVNTLVEGEAFATGLLALKKAPVTTIEYSTVKAGIEPGQRLHVILPSKGVPDSWFLVDQIQRQSEGVDLGDGSTFRTTVTLTSVARDVWSGVWRELRDRTRRSVPPVYEKCTFWLAVTGGDSSIHLNVGDFVTNGVLIKRRGLISDVTVYFDTPPTERPIILRIKKNGVSLMDGNQINYPTTTPQEVKHYTSWSSEEIRKVVPDDVISIDVMQTGLTTPGANGTVVVYIERSV